MEIETRPQISIDDASPADAELLDEFEAALRTNPADVVAVLENPVTAQETIDAVHAAHRERHPIPKNAPEEQQKAQQIPEGQLALMALTHQLLARTGNGRRLDFDDTTWTAIMDSADFRRTSRALRETKPNDDQLEVRRRAAALAQLGAYARRSIAAAKAARPNEAA